LKTTRSLCVLVEGVHQRTLVCQYLARRSDHSDLRTCRTPADHRTERCDAGGRHEDPHLGGDRVSGLAIVASVCRAWGSTPMSSGKTVWAVLGPENQL
jgi:hypothetical protein